MKVRLKVVRENLTSIWPGSAYCEGRQIAGPIRYEVGKWVEAPPGSLGIFLFEVETAQLDRFLEAWADRARAFECEAQWVRSVRIVINPGCRSVIQLSRRELLALKTQSAALLGGRRFHPPPSGAGYTTLVADRIRLVRELKRA